MKKLNMSLVLFIAILCTLSCSNSSTETTSTTEKAIDIESSSSDSIQDFTKYEPLNTFCSSFGLYEKFDITIYHDLLDSDSVEAAISYLEENKPPEMDSSYLNTYKSNLAGALIRQGKFKEVVELLNDVINTENNHIQERLLRSEAFAQIDSIDEALIDLDYVIENGVRFAPRAYRQRGIFKHEILNDSIGGCEDLKRGISNDYTKKFYRKYCN